MKKLTLVLMAIALSLTMGAQTTQQRACSMVTNQVIDKSSATVTSDNTNPENGIRIIRTELPAYYDLDLFKTILNIVKDKYSDVTTYQPWTLCDSNMFDTILFVTDQEAQLLITFYPEKPEVSYTFFYEVEKK